MAVHRADRHMVRSRVRRYWVSERREDECKAVSRGQDCHCDSLRVLALDEG